MTDAFSEHDEDAPRFELQRKHWVALVAVFALVEIVVLISYIS